MIRFIVFLFCLLTLFSAVLGEIATKLECDDSESKKCEVEEVRVNPCKEANKTPPQPCKLKRGRTGNLEVDFVPNFSASNLTVQLYWANGLIDVPLANMETDACKSTTCPSEVGVQQTYKFDLHVEKYFPLGTFQVKFILNGDKPKEEQCCFLVNTKIVK